MHNQYEDDFDPNEPDDFGDFDRDIKEESQTGKEEVLSATTDPSEWLASCMKMWIRQKQLLFGI